MPEAMKPGQVTTIKASDGTSFDAHRTAHNIILVSTSADGDHNSIVVHGALQVPQLR